MPSDIVLYTFICDGLDSFSFRLAFTFIFLSGRNGWGVAVSFVLQKDRKATYMKSKARLHYTRLDKTRLDNHYNPYPNHDLTLTLTLALTNPYSNLLVSLNP